VSERLGHSTVAFTMDVHPAVIPSMGRAAADAADQLSVSAVHNLPTTTALATSVRGRLALVDGVHPTVQKSKKCPQVEGLPVVLSKRHAKIRRDGYRCRAPEF